MKKKLLVLFFILTLFASFFFLWWTQSVKPTNPSEMDNLIFTIEKGEGIKSISERLANANLVRSKIVFFLYIRLSGIADKIQAGEFRLNKSMDLYSLANSLTHGTMDVAITIPEGWRREEIALKVAREFSIPEGEFLKYAKEGYMFPDTYFIPKDTTASEIATIFKNNFEKKFALLDINKLKAKKIDPNQLIIIASLVEREAKHDEDRPLIASVILNRLEIGMKLDIDATIQYALGYQANEKNWWKKNLTIEDIGFESTFNTYLNPGLPPTPICNPGLESIQAVIDAPDTEYFYYIADSSGISHFAKNIEEHNRNIEKYLNKQ